MPGATKLILVTIVTGLSHRHAWGNYNRRVMLEGFKSNVATWHNILRGATWSKLSFRKNHNFRKKLIIK